MVSAADKPDEEEQGDWKTFLLDTENKTVLGRSATSWFHVTLFYAAYYSLIAVISYYSIMGYQDRMVIFPKEKNAIPTTQTRVASPGVGTFPAVDVMTIDSNRVNSVLYIDSINNRLQSIAENDDLKHTIQDNMGECSPICSSTDVDCKFPPLRKSYASGNPCIYYQINKVMLWKPYAYNSLNSEWVYPRNDVEGEEIGDSWVSEAVGDNFEQDNVYFYCYDLDAYRGYVNETDRIEKFTYWSSDDTSDEAAAGKDYGFFNFKHWPIPTGSAIKKMENPVVAVQYKVNEKYHGQLINVACQAYAANLGPNEKINEAYAATAITVEAAGSSTIAKINEEYREVEEEVAVEEVSE